MHWIYIYNTTPTIHKHNTQNQINHIDIESAKFFILLHLFLIMLLKKYTCTFYSFLYGVVKNIIDNKVMKKLIYKRIFHLKYEFQK